MVNTETIIAIIGATVGALLGSASSILFGLMMYRWQQKRILGIYLCGMAEDGWLAFMEDSPTVPG